MTAESHSIADAAERERALTPDRSFIVQAPAGSGKTELLTRRYLRLLSCVNHPEEIIAITFTRRAAAEMRARVLEAIERARLPRPGKDHEAATWDLARAALLRDERLGWNLVGSPERLRVSTIDAFCAALIRQMPMLSRLGALPAIVEDAADLYREAARESIANADADSNAQMALERLFAHLDNDVPRIEGLIADMLSRRDQWLRHVALGSPPERAVIEEALRHVIEDALAKLRAAIPEGEIEEIVRIARFAAENLQSAGIDSAITACQGMEDLPGTAAGDLPRWRGLGCLLTTNGRVGDDRDWRKTVNKNHGFPAPGDAANQGERARREEMKERFKAMIGRLSARPGLIEHLRALPDLPPPHYEDGQWEVVEALCRLLPRAVASLQLVFQRRGRVDFTHVAWSALRALGPRDEPTDLALALDYRIQHLLVDEFQDTSLSQFELLETLTAGWTPGDGRTLFVVGDPMQSIYRFRQAEVGLFLRAWHRGIGGVALDPIRLKVNFRSQQGIVDWVNQMFERILPCDEDVAAGAVPYSPAVAHHPARPGPAVTLHPFVGRDDGKEAEEVVALVRRAMMEEPQGTIAILVRARGHLFEIAPRLRRAGLKFRAVEIETLGHRGIVQDLLALTRALVHPGDRLSWLALLRAPWCGLRLADLEVLAGSDPHSAIWAQMQDTERVARLSEDGRARLARVRAVIAECLEARRRRPLRRLVEGAWIALGGPACAVDDTDLADAMAYLDALEEMEVGGDLVEIDTLSQRVEKLFALPDVTATDARIELMTIHKAKGLQFNTVIVPGLGRGLPPDESRLLAWVERPDVRARGGADLLLAPICEAGQKDEPILRFLMRFERTRARYEDGRILYVAATRAIDRLHLLGAVGVGEKDGERQLKAPRNDSLLQQIWPVARADFERALEELGATALVSAADPVATGPRTIRRLPLDWRLPGIPEPVSWARDESAVEAEGGSAPVEFRWAREAIRHLGTVVHWALQHLGREGIDRWTKERVRLLRPALERRLREEGLPSERVELMVSLAETALTRTLSDPRGRWLFDPRHRDAHVEYAISGFVDGTMVNAILDRTFVDDKGVRWIVDYKVSSHEGGGLDEFLDRERERYAPQLERYGALMSAMDVRPIRLGLYFPLLGGWREWERGRCPFLRGDGASE